MRKLFMGLCAVALAACSAAPSGEATLIGSWVEPVPGMPGQVQGIMLEEGGKASSINMATLVYTAWEQDGDTLTLTGQSIGNGQTIDFSETWKIETLTPDDLLLSQNDSLMAYTRQK